ncbi:hypothetical protein T4B_9669 [Trichinella pseudospiralis]|uniref:Uncharacterized protein n=2 Tax=Trichinella pseudospiralis TaxID=6337 RepID=A0A0V1JLM9_TRIPS|nr:hypothetical protein T4D_16796 [Trichinella pseudospiralis]KRZ20597.1 hypothetical protein T4B_9669 [Trichinella pseudospiralis]KRZ35828.1 hypothetical protein T4C_12300 [Trichinella pseudospiralis]
MKKKRTKTRHSVQAMNKLILSMLKIKPTNNKQRMYKQKGYEVYQPPILLLAMRDFLPDGWLHRL